MKRLEDNAEKISGSKKAAHAEEYVGKGKMTAYHENLVSIVDMVGQCKYVSNWGEAGDTPISPGYQAALLSAGLGRKITEEMLFDYAIKLRNYYRAFEMREGFTRDDDTLPKRLFEPMSGGKYDGEKLDWDQFEKMKEEYYQCWDWDVKTGIPTRESLEKIGLKQVATDLERRKVFEKPLKKRVPEPEANESG